MLLRVSLQRVPAVATGGGTTMASIGKHLQLPMTSKGEMNGGARSAEPGSHSFMALVIGSIGVVYGDIGTSPLYAFREATKAAIAAGGGLEESVLGVLSLVLWSLLVIVTGKYVTLLLRADNAGEGGTFALMALAQTTHNRYATHLLWLGMIGVIMASPRKNDTPIMPSHSRCVA
jgi:K+ transporter